jgi:hypothetical protein
VKLEPLSPRRPHYVDLSRRRLRQSRGDFPSTSPARVTQFQTFVEAECRREVTEDYFRFDFLRFVFFAVFFAADFVFDLALFAMLPS